jgi:hypothetical protein
MQRTLVKRLQTMRYSLVNLDEQGRMVGQLMLFPRGLKVATICDPARQCRRCERVIETIPRRITPTLTTVEVRVLALLWIPLTPDVDVSRLRHRGEMRRAEEVLVWRVCNGLAVLRSPVTKTGRLTRFERRGSTVFQNRVYFSFLSVP